MNEALNPNEVGDEDHEANRLFGAAAITRAVVTADLISERSDG